MVKKLIVEEFEVKLTEKFEIQSGYKYSFFKDPETGKYYRPKSDFVVTGESLEELFEEIEVSD